MKFAATLPASDNERTKGWYAAVFLLEPTEITAVNIRVDDVEVTVAELKARGAVFEEYDFGEVFRTVDGIATSAVGEKMAWLKDPEGNLVSFGSH